MTKGLIKRFSYGAAFAFVVLLSLLAAGAMFFTDDIKEEILSPEYKSTQVMEIRGSWLGMRMISLDSPAARRSGVPPSVRGVMVVEIEDRIGWRARQAGVQEDDVILAVNGKEIRDLADLYDLSHKLDSGSAIYLNILRWGQPMTLMLPAVYAAPSVAGQPQVELEFQTAAPMIAQGGNAGAVQPAALVRGSQGPMFNCPIHKRVWPQNEVHPHYRCLIGNCPLSRVPSLPQAGQGFQTAPMTAQKGNAGTTQLAALVRGSQGPMFNCPIHKRVWPQNEVHPHYRCPLCYYQLNRVR